MLEMFSQFLAGQSLGFTLTALVPANPPALDIFPLVNPNLFHGIYCIVIIGV